MNAQYLRARGTIDDESLVHTVGISTMLDRQETPKCPRMVRSR